MRGASLFIAFTALFLTASCVRSPVLVANAGDVLPAATDAVPSAGAGMIEMPPLYVVSTKSFGQKIEEASADATALSARELNCPAVRVRRADLYQRPDGTTWTVVRMNVCGEERVYEKTLSGWNDATARLR